MTPEPQTVVYPTLLRDFQAPTLRVYPVYTVIAEKYQAMVMLGQANSRMKQRQWQAFLNKHRRQPGRHGRAAGSVAVAADRGSCSQQSVNGHMVPRV